MSQKKDMEQQSPLIAFMFAVIIVLAFALAGEMSLNDECMVKGCHPQEGDPRWMFVFFIGVGVGVVGGIAAFFRSKGGER